MDITALTNVTIEAVSQVLGADYMTADDDGTIVALDNAKLVDIGTSIENMESGVENFTKALIDQLAKIYIISDRYKADLPDIFVDSFEWGGFVECVQFNLSKVINDPMFSLVDGQSYATEEHTFYKPSVNVKIFQERKAIALPWSIAREQVMTAFKSIDELNSFVSGIQVNVENTTDIILEVYAHMLLSTAVAISDKATNTSVHLITEYNAETGETETSPTVLLQDEAFLAWVSRRIKDIRRNISKMTAAFNDGTVPTFTPAGRDKMVLIGKFVDAIKFNLRADTYHEDLVGFGDYKELAFWQGHYLEGDDTQSPAIPDTDFTFDNVTLIDIAADSTGKLGIGKNEVKIDNVVGLIYDQRAIGLCPYRVKVTSNYTASADFTTYWKHLLLNYIVNSSFNMVALIMD